MRYWVISELFYPDEVSTGYVMTNIARKLSSSYEVNVICGPVGYQSNEFVTNKILDDNINIYRIELPRFNKNNIFKRALYFVILSSLIFFKAFIKIKRNDKVILVTNPPTLLPLIALVVKLKGASLITIIHDVFPENTVPSNILKKANISYKIIDLTFKWAYNNSAKLIVVGKDMLSLISNKINREIPIKIITNWADHEEVFNMNYNRSNYYDYYDKKNDLVRDNYIIQFAGNLGRVQGLDKLFQIFASCSKLDFNLIFIGNGAMRNNLEKTTKDNNWLNVFFINPKPRTEQCDFLNNMDIGLVTLLPGMYGLGVPSKVYNILSAGKPIIYIGDENSEIANYVNMYNLGWAFNWEDSSSIKLFFENIKKISIEEISEKGRNARLLVENKFTKELILEDYYSFITQN